MIDQESKTDIQKIIDDFGPKIAALSHRMILNRDVAKEAAQEVWYEITRSLHSYKGLSSISTWIYTIAKRTIMKCALKERTFSDSEINDHFDKPEIQYAGDASERLGWIKEKCDYCLTAFCHCLDSEARLILLFRKLIGLPYGSIANIMETTEVNVRKILSRSRRKMENFMNDNCILYNKNSNCRCRIKKAILNIDLRNEYEKYRNIRDLADLYIQFDKELPRKNYWEKFL